MWVIEIHRYNASYWFRIPFSVFRYSLYWIWLAETNRWVGHLVLFDLDLALEVGLFPFGLGFFIFKVLKGQRLTSAYTLFIAASQQSIYTLTSCDPFYSIVLVCSSLCLYISLTPGTKAPSFKLGYINTRRAYLIPLHYGLMIPSF